MRGVASTGSRQAAAAVAAALWRLSGTAPAAAGGGRNEEQCIANDVVLAARSAHEMLDEVMGPSHSLAAAVRRAGDQGLDKGLCGRVRRLAVGADALRHTTRPAISKLLRDLGTGLAEAKLVAQGAAASSSDDESAQGTAAPALSTTDGAAVNGRCSVEVQTDCDLVNTALLTKEGFRKAFEGDVAAGDARRASAPPDAGRGCGSLAELASWAESLLEDRVEAACTDGDTGHTHTGSGEDTGDQRAPSASCEGEEPAAEARAGGGLAPTDSAGPLLAGGKKGKRNKKHRKAGTPTAAVGDADEALLDDAIATANAEVQRERDALEVDAKQLAALHRRVVPKAPATEPRFCSFRCAQCDDEHTDAFAFGKRGQGDELDDWCAGCLRIDVEVALRGARQPTSARAGNSAVLVDGLFDGPAAPTAAGGLSAGGGGGGEPRRMQ